MNLFMNSVDTPKSTKSNENSVKLENYQLLRLYICEYLKIFNFFCFTMNNQE